MQELRPYVALVDARKAKNPNSEAWPILQGCWGVVVDAARAMRNRLASYGAVMRIDRPMSAQVAYFLQLVHERPRTDWYGLEAQMQSIEASPHATDSMPIRFR